MLERRITTPIGVLCLRSAADAIVSGDWQDDQGMTEAGPIPDDPLLHVAAGQIEDYFAGRRRQFDLPFAPHGTAFQRRVWRLIAEIPFGQFITYGVLARRLGDVAAQAVGQACARNPIPLLIPCHRVLAAGGRLGGYSGAEPVKAWLLRHEGITITP